jgi:hypothetical protein
MDDTRISKQFFLYTGRGRRDIGYPRKSWKAEAGIILFHSS